MISLTISKNSEHWGRVSSSAKKLHQDMLFDSSSSFGFPDVLPSTLFTPPEELLSFQTPSTKRGKNKGHVHFFIEDYQFETIWSKPFNLLSIAQRSQGVLSPTFSVYSTQPHAMNMWNVYRNRWISRYLQENGVEVLPVATWCDDRSFEYAFESLPVNDVICVSTVGCLKKDNREMFVRGFRYMMLKLVPQQLVIYGDIDPIGFDSLSIPVYRYPSEWKKKREAIGSK